MIHLNKLGNIKVGGTNNGLPEQYQTLSITKSSKKGEESFELFDDSLKDLNSISILLPFMNFEESFDSGLISFVSLNNGLKYYVKQVEDKILAFPLQPNFKNPNIPLPVILMGLVGDKKVNWVDKLQMTTRAILYAQIVSKEDSDNGLPRTLGGNGIFMFKTSSAHTISEIKSTLSMLKSTKKDTLRLAQFKLEVNTKILGIGDIEEVTYVRLLAPELHEIGTASKLSIEFPEVIDYLKSTEEIFLLEKATCIEKAISMEEASVFFDKKITFKIDNSFGTEVSGPTPDNKEKKSVNKEDIKKAKELAKKYSLPEPVVLSLISRYKENSEKVILDNGQDLSNIIIAIGK